MNVLRVTVLLFVFAVAASFAEETNTLPTTITVDGVTYSNVTWRTVTPTTVSILHKTGVASIPLEKLPPELQQKFGYDPQKAAAYRTAEAATRNKQAQFDQKAAVRRQELAAFEADRQSKLLVGGALVDKAKIKGESVPIGGTIREKRADGTILEMAITDTVSANPILGGVRTVQVGTEYVIVLNYFPTEAIGLRVFPNGVPINPVGGMRAFDMGKVPTFDEWKKLQLTSKP